MNTQEVLDPLHLFGSCLFAHILGFQSDTDGHKQQQQNGPQSGPCQQKTLSRLRLAEGREKCAVEAGVASQ